MMNKELPIKANKTYIPRELFAKYDPKDLMAYGIRKWPDGKAVEINLGVGSKTPLLVPMDEPITYQDPNWYIENELIKKENANEN